MDDSRFFSRLLLNRLHPNARIDDLPVLVLGIRIEIVEFLHAGGLRLKALLHEILHQVEVVNPNPHQRNDVAGPHRQRKVGMTSTIMEKFSSPSREGTEEKGAFSIDYSGIQMRHRHRRSSPKSLSVNLGSVLFHDLRISRDHPLTSDWKSSITFDFGDPGFLQQGK